MSELAIWRRLDIPGHDAARLTRSGAGWSLRGMAVFKHEAGPACLNYLVDLDASWRTKHGRIRGFLGESTVDYVIHRAADGWYLNDALISGLDHLGDLDYGFTPSTNLQQLRRVAIEPGQAVELPVAWFDIDAGTLTELPQYYERRSDTTYLYRAPTIPYQGVLDLSRDGFVAAYPGLWTIES